MKFIIALYICDLLEWLVQLMCMVRFLCSRLFFYWLDFVACGKNKKQSTQIKSKHIHIEVSKPHRADSKQQPTEDCCPTISHCCPVWSCRLRLQPVATSSAVSFLHLLCFSCQQWVFPRCRKGWTGWQKFQLLHKGMNVCMYMSYCTQPIYALSCFSVFILIPYLCLCLCGYLWLSLPLTHYVTPRRHPFQ